MTKSTITARTLYRVAFALARKNEKLPSYQILTAALKHQDLFPTDFHSLRRAFETGGISDLGEFEGKPISRLRNFYLTTGLGVKHGRHIIPNPGAPKPDELTL